jgi:hypothetical protein
VANHYVIWLNDLTTGQRQVIPNQQALGTALTLTALPALISGHTFQWWVGAASANGLVTAWSTGASVTWSPATGAGATSSSVTLADGTSWSLSSSPLDAAGDAVISHTGTVQLGNIPGGLSQLVTTLAVGLGASPASIANALSSGIPGITRNTVANVLYNGISGTTFATVAGALYNGIPGTSLTNVVNAMYYGINSQSMSLAGLANALYTAIPGTSRTSVANALFYGINSLNKASLAHALYNGISGTSLTDVANAMYYGINGMYMSLADLASAISTGIPSTTLTQVANAMFYGINSLNKASLANALYTGIPGTSYTDVATAMYNGISSTYLSLGDIVTSLQSLGADANDITAAMRGFLGEVQAVVEFGPQTVLYLTADGNVYLAQEGQPSKLWSGHCTGLAQFGDNQALALNLSQGPNGTVVRNQFSRLGLGTEARLQ